MKQSKNIYHWGPEADFLVIGSGVAGLRAAIELSQHGRVLIITKGSRMQSNSVYAQGGVAVALSEEDDVNLHFCDTIKAGHHLGREESRSRGGALGSTLKNGRRRAAGRHNRDCRAASGVTSFLCAVPRDGEIASV